MIRTKRVYDTPTPEDGVRVLVDRLWPRGLSKDRARIDEWIRELAPSAELRRWFGHDPARWEEFQTRYHAELSDPSLSDAVEGLLAHERAGTVTLVFAARDGMRNNAIALERFLRQRR